MSLSGKLTRELITMVLERGQKYGLDVAGSFLGPAWPFVRPLVEKLLEDLPADIAGKWQNNEEVLRQAIDEIGSKQKQIGLITEALERHGIDDDWASNMTKQISTLSDDVFEVLCNQAVTIAELSDVKQGLTKLLSQAEAYGDTMPAKLVFRGSDIEFVDMLKVPDDFQVNFDLSPTVFALDSIHQRHMPAGFLVWIFSIYNEGQKNANISKIVLDVIEEGPCPTSSVFDELKPTLDPVSDDIEIQLGETSYPLFKGQRLGYAPDEYDIFRVLFTFRKEAAPHWQRLRPIIFWSDATGEHRTLGTDIFLASHPSPQVALARKKFGVSHG